MTVASRQFPGVWNQKEKWYGTEYTYEKIPADLLDEINQAFKNPLPELHLPRENEFIPRNLEAVIMDEELVSEPRLIRNDGVARVWYKKGLQVPGYKKGFQAPRAYLTIHCRNPLAHATAKTFVMARLYAELVKDAMEQYSYNARLAGLRYSVQGRSTGIRIQLSGYVTMLHVILDQLLNTMRDLQVQQGFEAAKDRLSSFLENYASLKPHHQVFWLARWLDRENWYTHKQMLAELRALTAADVEEFYPRLLGQMHIEILVGGGICKEDALGLSSMVETVFKPAPLPQAQWPMVARSLAFPPASKFVYHQTLIHSEIVGHCIDYRLYTGPRFDGPARAKTLLLEQMTHAPAFGQLRTQEQLGYVIFIDAGETATNMSYRILIQGSRAPMFLEGRIDAFLTGFADILGRMPDSGFDSEFEIHKRSLVREQLEKSKSKNLKEEASRVWSHIKTGHLDFTLGMPSPGLY
jgi:insulysin